MKVPSLRAQAATTVAVLAAGFALVFFYAPLDREGFIQKIFYLHVPLAICSLAGFVVAGIHAIRHLRSGDPVHDARSYVSIHLSVIFGVAVLLTGSIWARAEWGKWWVWDEPTLVRFELAAKSASAKLSRLRRALEGEAYAPARTGSRIAPGVPSRAASASWMSDPTTPRL